MADVELMIKISEDSYKVTCNGCMLPPDIKNVVQGIKNGILLQEHGDLIDVSELPTTTEIREDGSEMTYVPYTEIEQAQIIIASNKEE